MNYHTKYIILIIMLLSGSLRAQELIVNWTKFVSCGNTGSVGNGGVVTDDGGFLFIGNNPCSNSGDYPITNLGAQDLIVGKVDANDQIVWLKNYGGSGDDLSQQICRAHDGGYAILSQTYSNDGDVAGYKGAGDLWLLKIDKNGNKLWSKSYGSTYDEQAVSVALTPDNGFIVLGVSNGFGDDVPSHYGSSQFLFDWFVLKVDEDGNKQWSRSLGGSKDEQQFGQILSIDTSYYLIAYSDSKDYECTDHNWNPGVATSFDGYILKLDNSGNVVWNKVYGGTGSDVFYSAFYDGRDNTIMIAGKSGSNNYYVSGNHGDTDFWVLKTDLDGNIIWNKLIGGSKGEVWSTITTGPQGGYMLYGYTDSGKYSRIDSWLFALDKNGNVVKDKFVGGNKNESSYFIFPYQQGYMTVGYSMSDSFEEGMNNKRHSAGVQLHLTKLEYFPLGTNEKEKGVELLVVYPNPSPGNFTIEVPAKAKGTMKIVNAKGQLVYTVPVKKKSPALHIDASEWPPGTYVISFDAGDGKSYRTTLAKK